VCSISATFTGTRVEKDPCR